MIGVRDGRFPPDFGTMFRFRRTALEWPTLSLTMARPRPAQPSGIDLTAELTAVTRPLPRSDLEANWPSSSALIRRSSSECGARRRVCASPSTTAVIGEFDRHRYCDPALVEARGCGRSMPVNPSSLVLESAFGIGASKRPWCPMRVEQVADGKNVAPRWWVSGVRR